MNPAWVIVTGDVTLFEGQGKANYWLASYLATHGAEEVHLVAHRVDEPLASAPNVVTHLVKRPFRSDMLGIHRLDAAGIRVARDVRKKYPNARLVANGANCRFEDIAWIHALHHAWPLYDGQAPGVRRLKNRLAKWYFRKLERKHLPRYRLFFANSDKTGRDLVEHMHVPEERVKLLYLGNDPTVFGPVAAEERQRSRSWLGLPLDTLVVTFIGALGFDHNKGFDTTLDAWRILCQQNPGWPAQLVAAGGGTGLDHWRRQIASRGITERVRLLGFCDRIPDLLAATDLFVSASRYEAYGLSVQEAIARGVPAIVSSTAGIAERYPAELSHLVLSRPENGAELAEKIAFALDPDRFGQWSEPMNRFADLLRNYTWDQMGERFVKLAEERT